MVPFTGRLLLSAAIRRQYKLSLAAPLLLTFRAAFLTQTFWSWVTQPKRRLANKDDD